MKAAVATIVIALAVAVSLAADKEFSWEGNSDVIEKVLANQRLLNSYYKCLMDQGPCSPDAQSFKRALPDAIKSQCAKCSDKQKNAAKKIVTYMQEKRPEDWKAFTKKYDPERKNPALYAKSN